MGLYSVELLYVFSHTVYTTILDAWTLIGPKRILLCFYTTSTDSTLFSLCIIIMFSFRRKPKQQEVPRIRTSPSLPELNSQGIPWPENLVDIAAIQEAQSAQLEHLQQGAAKVSFQGSSSHAVPFHKPFRDSPGTFKDRGPISSLYMSNPPSAFPNRQTENATPLGRYSHRRARVPPTFNLMVSAPFLSWSFVFF